MRNNKEGAIVISAIVLIILLIFAVTFILLIGSIGMEMCYTGVILIVIVCVTLIILRLTGRLHR